MTVTTIDSQEVGVKWRDLPCRRLAHQLRHL